MSRVGEYWVYHPETDEKFRPPPRENRIVVERTEQGTLEPRVSNGNIGLSIVREGGGSTLVPWQHIARLDYVTDDELKAAGL